MSNMRPSKKNIKRKKMMGSSLELVYAIPCCIPISCIINVNARHMCVTYKKYISLPCINIVKYRCNIIRIKRIFRVEIDSCYKTSPMGPKTLLRPGSSP